MLSSKNTSANSQTEIFKIKEILSLEQYLQEYFGQILRKLKEANYQQTQRSSDISFL